MGHHEILGIDAWLDEEGLVQGSATGSLGPQLQGYLDFYLSQLNKNPVLAVRNGGNVYSLFLPPIPSEAAVLDLTRKLMRKLFGRTIPSTCTLSTINTCQADCIHCSAAQSMQQSRENLSTEEFKAAVDQALELGVVNVTLSGGEPLLRKDLFDIVAHVEPDKANCMMFTNGELLTRENARRLKEAGMFSVMVSLDSPRAADHDAMRRRPGMFDKAVDGIRNLLEEEVLVGISTYASHENIDNGDLEAIMRLGGELGVQEVVIFDSVPTGAFLRNCECILTEPERETIRAWTEEWREDPAYPSCISMSWVNSPQGAGCFAANEQFYMTSWGDIGPCDFTPFTFGNVKEEPLETIWMRMLSHPAYQAAHQSCRMQDPDFRRAYIDPLPEDIDIPIQVWKHPELFKETSDGFKPQPSAKQGPVGSPASLGC
jgi:MoaA/NifB/PqqE/SkfB family radical SAM enzyme